MRLIFVSIWFVCISVAGIARPAEAWMQAFAKADRWYFRIPASVLQQDVLFVTRITGNAYEYEVYGAGKEIHKPVMARWEKSNDHLLLRMMLPHLVTEGDEPIYEAVRNNNVAPVLYRFKIESALSGQENYVVDVTDFFAAGVPWMRQQSRLELSGIDKSRSEILSVQVYARHTQVKQRLTFKGKGLPENPAQLISIELSHAMVLLPEDKMIPRFHTQGIQAQTIDQLDYGVKGYNPAKNKWIVRWRLVPSDWDAFEKGFIVKPIKPIIFYIDPATPKVWRPYVKQGVEAWLPVFERLGFHHAIEVREPPTQEDDSEWSVDNLTYSVIRYVIGRAVAHGTNISDPRTGEILQASVQWGHGRLVNMADRFFVETAAANPDARGRILKEEVMGKLIKSLIAHEVGHTLGLHHYFGASNHYPVDSLRSPTFTRKHGLSASIMDYAWGNYIAQPGDSLVNFYPQIGEYDAWIIHYLYKPLRGITHPEEEKDSLDHWLKQWRIPITSGYWDDLGDDAIHASVLGLKNLRLIINNLLNWSDVQDADRLKKIYLMILKQYEIYLDNVLTEWVKQSGHSSYDGISRKAVLVFLKEHFFNQSTWLVNQEVKQIAELSFITNQLAEVQKKVLFNVLVVQSSNLVKRGSFEEAGALLEEIGFLIFGDVSRLGSDDRILSSLMIECMTEILLGKVPNAFQSQDLVGLAHEAAIKWRKILVKNRKMVRDERSARYWQRLIDRIDNSMNRKSRG